MKLPTLRILCTIYPDLAGLLMRNWEKEGLLIVYHHGHKEGFAIVAVYPRWRWVPRLVFRYWQQWPSLAAFLRFLLAVAGGWFLLWLFFGTGSY
ncbi:MAG: hypothetical protein HYT88_03700 [Candidatus Omnitrophica bacterium]|nr:hypothetical protein [Candidatus Omnitrophota bacterium]